MSRRFGVALGAIVALALVVGLCWWAIASGAKPCQPGYEYRYAYTQIVGKTQIAHYQCVRVR